MHSRGRRDVVKFNALAELAAVPSPALEYEGSNGVGHGIQGVLDSRHVFGLDINDHITNVIARPQRLCDEEVACNIDKCYMYVSSVFRPCEFEC